MEEPSFAHVYARAMKVSTRMSRVGIIAIHVEKFSNNLVKKITIAEICLQNADPASSDWRYFDDSTDGEFTASSHMDGVRIVYNFIKTCMAQFSTCVVVLNDSTTFVKTLLKARGYRKRHGDHNSEYSVYSKHKHVYTSVEEALNSFEFNAMPSDNAEGFLLLERFLDKKERAEVAPCDEGCVCRSSDQ